MYPAKFPGLGEALIFFCFFSSIKGRPLPGQGSFSRYIFHPHTYPAKFPGLGEALIFFCFFSSIKGRKEDYESKKKYPSFDADHSFPTENTQGAYAIRPYSLPADRFRIRFATSSSKTRRVSLRLVAKSKTRRVLRHVVWQSPKPAGFYAMSCGKVQNPPGFTPCRVAKSKTRRVSRYVVWQSPKPVGFYAMSCGRVQNPPSFTLCRVAECETHRPVGGRGVLHTPLGRFRPETNDRYQE